MDEQCQYSFTDKNEAIIACSVHKNERVVLSPAKRKQVLTQLLQQHKWGGRLLQEGEIDVPKEGEIDPTESLIATTVGLPPAVLPTAPQLPAQQHTSPSTDLVEYQTPDGQQVAVSITMFQQMICPDANANQARYMMNWCAHNRIDLFANEAYFSVIQNKPVIMVSKDCWFRRMERHPQFEYYDSGILVAMSMNELKNAVVSGMGDDYLAPENVKEKLLTEALEGKALDPKGFPSQIVIRKRGQYVAPGETLEGAWALIKRKDRPFPIKMELNADGWEGKTGTGDDNKFWTTKRPFMIWKTALKNDVRLTFPELAGLIAQRDVDDFDAAGAADYEIKVQGTNRVKLIRQLHAAGAQVPPPDGPFLHTPLHELSVILFDGKGIAELSLQELSAFVQQITNAQTDKESCHDLRSLIDDFRNSNDYARSVTAHESQAPAESGDESGDNIEVAVDSAGGEELPTYIS